MAKRGRPPKSANGAGSVKKEPTKKIEKTTRPKVIHRSELQQPLPRNACTCTMCGETYPAQKGYFNPSYSALWGMNNGFLPVCQKCIDKLYEHYCTVLGSEEAAIRRVCMKFDIFHSKAIELSTTKRRPGTSRMQAYIRCANLTQNRGKTFDDTLLIDDTEAIQNTEQMIQSDRSPVTKEMVEFWGPGMSEAEYLELDREYNDWISRCECKTKSQELLFKNISMAQLTVNKAFATGDTKRIKEANDNLQNLMTSANVKPNQKNESIGNELTYGQWIQKLEEDRPVADPEPAWKDVDKIGHYFRTWVLGTILDMFKLKNPYKEEYNEELARYTAKKPEYHADEDSPDDIYNIVFGLENADGGDG